ncbi:nose resistant to fluoxetine protein 6-like [Rhynchophorus ferrugineus]|uniref:nose resistant to fluoxetine protein 6-like n=1 Tax=Rhynchophorus ferrugineus TaxID=354439 RepID=UPI003FCD7CDA
MQYSSSVFLVLAVVLLGCVSAHFFGNVISAGNEVDSVLELYIPTIRSKNELCREHSKLYLKELKESKLWATEMFDSTAKFPTGMLHGSSYNFGIFDECINIKVPLDINPFNGKYCLMNITMDSHSKSTRPDIDWEFDDYTKFFNVSVTEKLAAFHHDLFRLRRHNWIMGVCLPSSCSRLDFKEGMEKTLSKMGKSKFTLSIEERDCQTASNQYEFNTGDFVFMYITGGYMLAVIIITFYYKYALSQRLQKDTWSEVMKCFSLSENTRKLLKMPNDFGDGLDHVAGFKVLSLFLVIAGHRSMFYAAQPLINPSSLEKLYHQIHGVVFMNGTIIVDSFFTITGFLSAYLILQRTAHSKSMNVPLLYMHRLVRFLPGYIVIIAFTATIFAKLGSGPLWKQYVGEQMENCQANWWTNLLFLGNYVNVENICVFQSWYLNCDIHFYLVTPLIVWIYKKNPQTAFVMILTLIGAASVMTFAIIYINGFDPIIFVYYDTFKTITKSDSFRDSYVPSHLRIIPYLIGIFYGFAKYKIRTTGYKFHKPLVRICWTVSAIFMCGAIYFCKLLYVPKEDKSEIFSALFAPAHRIAWSLAVGWMILASTEGHSGLLKSLTSWNPFIFLNRITFSAFLVHASPQLYSLGINRTPVYFSIYYLLWQSLGDIFLSYLLGYFLMVFFEAPWAQLESVIYRKKPQSKETAYESEKPLNIVDINKQDKTKKSDQL